VEHPAGGVAGNLSQGGIMIGYFVRAALLSVSVAALALPSAALAAQPKPGGSYRDCTGAHCKVNEIKVSADGSKVVQFIAYTDCNRLPFASSPALKITAAGTFSFAGPRTDVTRKVVKVEISGKFVTASLVRGTMRFSTPKCNSKTLSYRAVLVK
jgi:hypothetical protein